MCYNINIIINVSIKGENCMIRSMTGYGKGNFSDEKRAFTIEVKSVNHRYLDVTVKMPRKYNFAEDTIKNEVKKYLTRGKIEVSVQIDSNLENETVVVLNENLAKEYVDAIKEINKYTYQTMPASAEFIATLPEVLKVTTADIDEEEVLRAFAATTVEAIKDNVSMREREGDSLVADLKERVETLRTLLANIEEKAPLLTEIYREKLRARVATLLEGVTELPEDRIALEATMLSDKANITEEIVRMKSHLDLMGTLLMGGPGSGGKKMDFLIQEMNRETNTIGSKANDLEITNFMLDMKSEIEKIREQVQNIE